jgi:hypothetical protein
MSSSLKSLVTISVWILFVAGCLALVIGFLTLLKAGSGQAGATARAIWAERFWGTGLFSVFLSAVAAWFRKAIG